ncbi:MAG: oxidoreductase, partial [Arcobacter sp.]|nr:oxidoreductase [Arcobacter sp.]
NISYFATGSKSLAKEYMEVHFDEKSIILDDYKLIKGYGFNLKEIKSRKSDKGHLEELEKLHSSLTKPNSEWPIPLWDLIQTTEATFIIK